MERYSVGLFATFELDSGFELYLESTYADNTVAAELAPVPGFGNFQFTSNNPSFSPEARAMFADGYEIEPGLAAAFFGKRMLEVGPRQIDTENDYWRTAAGIRGTLTGTWDIDAWVTYTKSEEEEFQRPSPERINGFRRVLERRGVAVSLRASRGLDQNAACGQLRRQNKPDRAN